MMDRNDLIERLARVGHEEKTDGESVEPCAYCRTIAEDCYLPVVAEFVAEWMQLWYERPDIAFRMPQDWRAQMMPSAPESGHNRLRRV